VLKSALHEQAKQAKAANGSSSTQADPEDDAVKWQVRQLRLWSFFCVQLIDERSIDTIHHTSFWWHAGAA
jgi:hypothetical protein